MLHTWQQTSFLGLHTQPAKAENGHLYADDLQNLRIDGDGWLRLRSDALALDPDGENITGVAATTKHVFLLRSDGKLYVREIDTLETETEITGVSNLEGRISIVDFRTYVIITSEGTDQGYIVDLREGDGQYAAYLLGINAPGPSSWLTEAVASIPGSVESRLKNRTSAGLSANSYYHYLYTYVSIDDREDPWFGMESNPPDGDYDWEPVIKGDENLIDQRGVIYTGFSGQNRAVKITINYAQRHPLTSHVRIYRSSALPNSVITSVDLTEAEIQRLIRSHLESLQYRVVAEVPISQQSGTFDFYDGMSDEDWVEGELISFDNDRMPSNVKQIHEYNDLVFGAAGDRLVYSDLRNGNLVPWAFPAVNEIRVQGSVHFCAEINEVLLFGSRSGLWRLAGNTEYNFSVGQISGSGPVDGYAWSKITDTLAFVGEGGLYLTDASQVVRTSEVILDEFFQNRKAISGAVAFFKDGDVLFSVTLEDNDGSILIYQFKREDGYWVRWNLPFMQSTSIVSDNKATLVLIADNTGQLKQLHWNSTANEEEDVAWLYESQPLDAAQKGIANHRKRFSQFQFTGEADNEMTLQVSKENETEASAEQTFSARDSLNPVRVPINRIARRLRFKLSGTGPCKIQGMRLVIMV